MYALAATEAVGSIAYLLLACTGIAVSAFLWDRLAAIERTRGAPASREGGLMLVYAAALVGGLTGAKLAFLAAEGWNYADDWSALLSGKSITGALLGGYASVEIAKRALGITRTTGDRFAVLVPASIGIGRIGCSIAGCCAGVACDDSWYSWHDSNGASHVPTQAIEALFNFGFAGWALLAFRQRWYVGNCFHLYLIAYGVARFSLEFVRERIEIVGPLGGYHFAALALIVLGVLRWRRVGTVPSC